MTKQEQDERIYQRFCEEMRKRSAATMFTNPATIDVKAEAQKIADSIDAAVGSVIFEDIYGLR